MVRDIPTRILVALEPAGVYMNKDNVMFSYVYGIMKKSNSAILAADVKVEFVLFHLILGSLLSCAIVA